MGKEETRAFAQKLMEEVWEPFDSSAPPRFYHRGVIGHHRRADGSTQELGYADIANRLDWDRKISVNAVYDIRDIVAEEGRFAVQFVYKVDFGLTEDEIDVDNMYYYYLRDGKVAEWWLLASADFDYKATGAEGMPSR